MNNKRTSHGLLMLFLTIIQAYLEGNIKAHHDVINKNNSSTVFEINAQRAR